MSRKTRTVFSKRRMRLLFTLLCTFFVYFLISPPESPAPQVSIPQKTNNALYELSLLPVRERDFTQEYRRSQFGDGWAETNGCDTRNIILARDLTEDEWLEDGCKVASGILNDYYTGTQIHFMRGADTSDDVQIDHIVPLVDAWQKGAQGLSLKQRIELANDPLNLLAVDGDTNQEKSGSDASEWLPPDVSFRCRYVARQIAVKKTYVLWVTKEEKKAMVDVLTTCPEQELPQVQR